VVAQVTDDRLDDEAGERRREPEHRDLISARAEVLVDGAHVRHLECPAELDAQKPEAHVPDRQESRRRRLRSACSLRFGHGRLILD
jgi:hypothetical protein